MCLKVCHPKDQCVSSIEDLKDKGCGQKCMKPRKNCGHPCLALCHTWVSCPEVKCEAEMKHYCKCKNRFILTVCMSNNDRKPLECNNQCWKKQRDQRLANAFTTP